MVRVSHQPLDRLLYSLRLPMMHHLIVLAQTVEQQSVKEVLAYLDVAAALMVPTRGPL